MSSIPDRQRSRRLSAVVLLAAPLLAGACSSGSETEKPRAFNAADAGIVSQADVERSMALHRPPAAVPVEAVAQPAAMTTAAAAKPAPKTPVVQASAPKPGGSGPASQATPRTGRSRTASGPLARTANVAETSVADLPRSPAPAAAVVVTAPSTEVPAVAPAAAAPATAIATTTEPAAHTVAASAADSVHPVFAGDQLSRIYSKDDPGVTPALLLSGQSTGGLGAVISDINTMELVISKMGRVETVKLSAPPKRMTDMLLLSGAKTWKFAPAMKDGQPVRYRTQVSWETTR